MWDNYKQTKNERAVIERAWHKVYELTGHDWRTERMTRDEARGYGNRHDAIGRAGAQALAVKWFYEGTQAPDVKLSDYYFCRPAAIWFKGYGASKAYAISKEDEDLLAVAIAAHESAFKRMMDDTRAIA